jgi:hypothetical protein
MLKRDVLNILKKTDPTIPQDRLESRAIVLRDQSSSMSWVPSFPRIWNEQLIELEHLAPTLSVTLYSVSSQVEKLCDLTPIGCMEEIDETRWYYGDGGMLRGGTALGDAVIRGCQKAKQFRRLGFSGPLSVFLLTDGWSKDDVNPHFVAKNWLSHARDNLDVRFRMFGFVHENNFAKLNRFSAEIGIKAEENRIIPFSSAEQRDASLITSLESLKEGLYNSALL